MSSISPIDSVKADARLRSFHTTPVGVLCASWDSGALVELSLVGNAEADEAEKQADVFSQGARQLQMQLDQYFAGELTQFDIPHRFSGTAFQSAVWQELEKIPYGATSTYGELATKIGSPRAVRAVGTAVGKNPLCIILPCHRVLGKDSLGGYAYGLRVKKRLLDLEKQ